VTVEDLIVEALRRHPAPWPDCGEGLEQALLDAADDHGVAALLATVPAVDAWPDHVREALRSVTRFETAVEAIRRQQLIDLLACLQSEGVHALLLKGAHIAYSHYPRPWLRPRLDTDLLIAPGERAVVDRLLRGLGYEPGTGFHGELVTHQFQYRRTDRFGLSDVVDLHWKVANPHAFADAFSFEELAEEATTITALSQCARGVSEVDALMIACIHRAAHHANSDCLIWLYDIHLLAGAMSGHSRERFADRADRKRLRAVCGRGIANAQARFNTTLPDEWLERLMSLDGMHEPTAAFLRNGTTKLDILFSDLRTLPGRRRAALVREHLFPPRDYMRRSYGFSGNFFLPFAYVDRAVTGIGKWLRPVMRRAHNQP
jgi:hypothetical protein